jgi:glycosyltransferase involved in cell wall biosynthesis
MQIYERNIDVFIAPSQFLKDKFLEYGFENPIVHLTNFVNIEQFQPCYESDNYFVYYGRLVDYKGVFTLLEAMREVPDSHLYVAGDGDAAEEMYGYIAGNKLQNVSMLGHIDSQDLIPLIQNATATIVPSQWYENYSMSVIESLACATPVIGSRIGGITEQVLDGWNGLLFEPGSASELAQKMRYVLDNSQERGQMSLHARQRVEELNDPQQHYDKLMNIYESLLNVGSHVPV